MATCRGLIKNTPRPRKDYYDLARMELVFTALEVELLAEHERHAQMAGVMANAAASGMSQSGVARLESTMNRTLTRLYDLQMFNIHTLMRQHVAGGSVDDVVKLYSLIEDQLDELASPAPAT